MSESYIKIMIESLEQKSSVLDQVMVLDKEQEKIVLSSEPDLDALDKNTRQIGALAEKLNRLDDGFETVYSHVREDLQENKDRYKNEILRLKELISEVTEKSMKVQTEESVNRDRAKRCFDEKRRNIGGKRRSVNAASAYSKNMRNSSAVSDSFFLDKAK